MADIATTSAEPQSSPKSTVKKERKTKTDRPKATHPSTAIMVNNAIQNLKERGGSSLQAIKKYMSATYKVDAEKIAPFIKKYIKASVASGALVQTKGKGASGSFKLASTAVTKKSVVAASKPKKSAAASRSTKSKADQKEKKSTAAAATGRKTNASKAVKSRKSANLEKKKSSPAKVAKPKSPSKVKKTTKAPTKKPKSPKPKTTKPKVVKKKAASPKKK